MSLKSLFTRTGTGRHAAPDPRMAERDHYFRAWGAMSLADEEDPRGEDTYSHLFRPEPRPVRHAAQEFAAADRTDSLPAVGRIPDIVYPPTRGFRHQPDCLCPHARHSVCPQPGDHAEPGAWRAATETALAPVAGGAPATGAAGAPPQPETAVVLHHEHRWQSRPAPVAAGPEEPATERLASDREVMSARAAAALASDNRAIEAFVATVLSDLEQWYRSEMDATAAFIQQSWDAFLAAGTPPALTGGGQ